jgi:hypothetical protein
VGQVDIMIPHKDRRTEACTNYLSVSSYRE